MLNITLGQLLDLQAEKHPHRDAVVYYHEKIRWSYSQFRDRVNKIAKGLIKMGIKKVSSNQ